MRDRVEREGGDRQKEGGREKTWIGRKREEEACLENT